MLFNSYAFLLFFPLVTIVYFALSHRFRWVWLLAASCLFYMYFIPAYILILFATIFIDYTTGRLIEKSVGKQRRMWLWISIFSTSAILFFFKYFNFSNGNFEALAHWIGWNYSIQALQITLPIGLSFHTFQSLSYVIEVYYGRQKAEHHFGIFALYVMFYPQLVAGPIERPQNLLHQFHKKHSFEYHRIASGFRLMAWGFFKKIVIADRLAVYVNEVFNHPDTYYGLTMMLAVVFFTFQIYCDFSGYSDIAIGAARTMGFDLMKNFDRPYFSKSISEFWRRWHISLSTWFKDYVYIPLGGNRVVKWRWYYNLFITFLISGIWHGANWTFVIWGGLHGFYLVLALVAGSYFERMENKIGLNKYPALLKIVHVLTTFSVVCFAWIFFRANSVSDALIVIDNFFHWPFFDARALQIDGKFNFMLSLLSIFALGTIHFLQRRADFSQRFASQSPWIRWTVYYAAVISIILFGEFSQQQFIYFQF